MSEKKYTVLNYSEFNSKFKKVAKKYKRTFEKDFNLLVEVITKKLPLIGENPRKLPTARIIPRLGWGDNPPIIKMDLYISECREKKGRVTFLFDKKNSNILFIEVYVKNRQTNHDANLIKRAYKEYSKYYTI